MRFVGLGIYFLALVCALRCSSNSSDNMVSVPVSAINATAFSIDPYEAIVVGGSAQSSSGQAPEVNIDYATAKKACESAGKRLCTVAEWQAACRGPNNHKFAFQDEANNPKTLTDVCDVARTTNNTPGSLPSKTGAHPDCKSDVLALFDMIGNLAEWTTAADGTPVAAGVSFYQPSNESHCDNGLTDPGQTTISPATKSTDVGFRCCRDKSTPSSGGGGTSGTGTPPSFPFDT